MLLPAAEWKSGSGGVGELTLCLTAGEPGSAAGVLARTVIEIESA